MNTLLNTINASILLLGFSCVTYSQSRDTRTMAVTDAPSQEQRSAESLRILDDAGIKFERMFGHVLQLTTREDDGQVTKECTVFLDAISAMRESVKNNPSLTEEDIRYVDRQLERFQKKGEQLLENLPFGVKANN